MLRVLRLSKPCNTHFLNSFFLLEMLFIARVDGTPPKKLGRVTLTDVIQLTLTLKMTAQVVETLVNVYNNSPNPDYVYSDDETQGRQSFQHH